MKAAVLKDWLNLELTDIPMPVPGPDEALIKVRYGGVCGSDMVVYRHKHMTATIPRVLCHEILGTIETLPEGYDGPFHLGQRVLMNPVVSCGHCSACKRGLGHVCENLELLGIHRDGCACEYIADDSSTRRKTSMASGNLRASISSVPSAIVAEETS